QALPASRRTCDNGDHGRRVPNANRAAFVSENVYDIEGKLARIRHRFSVSDNLPFTERVELAIRLAPDTLHGRRPPPGLGWGRRDNESRAGLRMGEEPFGDARLGLTRSE